MSVLIKGLKMPKEGCKDCLLVKRGHFYDICLFLSRIVNGNVERGGKPYDCPLVELPDHGDLIDRDALIENAGMCVSDFGTPDEQWRPDRDWYLTINAQTIIIPAERSEDVSTDM